MDIMRFWMEVEIKELKQDAELVKAMVAFIDSTKFINEHESSFFQTIRDALKPPTGVRY
jgi:hypothetical protein